MTGDTPQVTATILAGGAGRRMSGMDKGWVDYDGQPFISHVVGRLAPQVQEIVISANRHRARYEALGFPVVSDQTSGYEGPFLGILAGMRAAQHPWVLIAPCDCLWLPTDLVARFLAVAHPSKAPIVVARTPEALQPVVALLHQSILPELTIAVAEGERSPGRWYQRMGFTAIDFSTSELANLNQFPD